LTLGRLLRAQIEALIGAGAGGKALPLAVVEQIATKTDGVPLFVEELTKMVLESGLLREEEDRYQLVGSLPSLAIPTTLQDSLMARLDRLATVKAVAQMGATIGRTFSYRLLQVVAGLDDTALRRELAILVEAELLYQRGVPPEATYTFKHALIQDAAYQALLRSTRQHYHQRIARALEAEFPELVLTQPELLAHHYTEAGLIDPAIVQWQRAGERALGRFANLEAISHLTRSLDLLLTLPEGPERAQRELGLQLNLAVPLILAKSWAAPEVERTYARARDLCRDVGEPLQLLRALRGLATFYWTRAELRTAREIAEECLALATRIGDPVSLRRAHLSLGYPLLWLGDFPRARVHLEAAIASGGASRRQAGVFVQDPMVSSKSSLAATLWLLGHPDRALETVREAVMLAEKLMHPFSLAMALHFSEMVHQFRREAPATEESAQASVSLSTQQGFPFWAGAGMISRGWAMAERGQAHEGVAEIRRGLAKERSTGTELSQPHGLALLADACRIAGLVEEGLDAVERALAAAQGSDERMYEAEIHRLTGELLLQKDREADAEECFCRALEVAARQQAKSLELRAAMSLHRLWQRKGKLADARRLLAGICNWFTEGFDTADLRDARALLD
jgi:predicted ATPase